MQGKIIEKKAQYSKSDGNTGLGPMITQHLELSGIQRMFRTLRNT